MLNNRKIGEFIASKRRNLGMTQTDVAGSLNVSFQAVSKWENGILPNVEILVELAGLLHVTVDENTNVHSLVRMLMDRMPQIKLDKVGGIHKIGNVDEQEIQP